MPGIHQIEEHATTTEIIPTTPKENFVNITSEKPEHDEITKAIFYSTGATVLLVLVVCLCRSFYDTIKVMVEIWAERPRQQQRNDEILLLV